MEGMAKRIARVAQCVQLCTVSWTRDERDEGFRILNIEDGWRVPGSICFFLASFDSTAFTFRSVVVRAVVRRDLEETEVAGRGALLVQRVVEQRPKLRRLLIPCRDLVLASAVLYAASVLNNLTNKTRPQCSCTPSM